MIERIRCDCGVRGKEHAWEPGEWCPPDGPRKPAEGVQR